jgi:hypothetical protein
VSDVFSKQCKKLSVSVISIILLAFIGVQLVQANRQEFARLYRGSFIQDSFAVAESMVSTPETSVIATPLHSMRVTRITYLSGRTTIIFAPETIEKLLDDRKLAEVFEQYGVTHISRYEDELTARMIRATSVRALDDDSPGPQSPRVTPAIQYLLHKVY